MKLESGRIDAFYSNVKRIFEKLAELEAEREEVTAGELANRPVVGVQLTDPMSKAIELMEKHSYSQLPVFMEKHAVGSISEGAVTDYLARGLDPIDLPETPVKELMEESFPQVAETAHRDVVVSLLGYFPAVLTTKGAE